MKTEIEVRPLLRGEESLWVSLGVEETERETRKAKLTEHLTQYPELPAENYLLAYANDQVVGKMSGMLESTGYIATKIVLPPAADKLNVSAALFSYIRRFGTIQALSWADREDDCNWREILKWNGFSVLQDKAYFRRSIAGYLALPMPSLTYKSMAKVGQEAILKIYGLTYLNNCNRNFSSSPEKDFRSHRESAGNLFDPNTWFIAYLCDQPVGVLLPQRFPDDPKEGTLMSFGVVPEYRGLGIGKALHSKGLEILGQQGATDYIGSTDLKNAPMIRIFEMNGCKKIGIRTTHFDSNPVS